MKKLQQALIRSGTLSGWLVVVLLVLWIPSLINQITNFSAFRNGMLRHSFHESLGLLLAYVIPMTEVIIIRVLLVPHQARYGFALSALMLATFSLYIGVALLTPWANFACFCSKLISRLSWSEHLWLNLIFLTISVVGYRLSTRHSLQGGTARGSAAEGGSA